MTDVLLISMPFGPLFRPSIGLGLLKASLRPLKISSEILYFTFPFAERVGTPFYIQVADGFPSTVDLVGEWIFSGGLFNQDDSNSKHYIETVLRATPDVDQLDQQASDSFDLNSFIQKAVQVRQEIRPYIEECLSQVAARAPRIVGFTSLFQQQLASLCLAERIKASLPDTVIVFGGANCEGSMGAEVVQRFSFVDAVISGEGDTVFPEFVRRVLARESLANLQGVFRKRDFAIKVNDHCYLNAPSIRDLDTLPIPDYDDYFSQFSASNLDTNTPPRLQFETSRGCWWGEIKHCTFCGLNGANMSYRSKSAERAIKELSYLAERYPCPLIEVVDNILDMKYFDDFIPRLAEEKPGLRLFYEVKSNLKKKQVRLLRDGGITEIQPGIESLSSRVLDLMRKGVTSLQNIQLLKWCKEFGVRPHWNLIWGFPEESPEDYEQMAALVPLISHLQPPEAIGALRLDRFSPNFRDADQLGFEHINPQPAYEHIYPFSSESLHNLAYYFSFNYKKRQDPAQYTQSLRHQIANWRNVFESSDLFYQDFGEFLIIFDLRPIAQRRLTVLTEPQRSLYIQCDDIQTTDRLTRLMKERSWVMTSGDTEELLDSLTDQAMMIREKNSFLSLAIRLGDYAPDARHFRSQS